MKLSGLSGGQYQPLSEADVATLHDAALGILERTGVTYEAGLEETAKMLEKAGATVDHTNHRISFPRELITAEVQKAPERVVLCGLDPANDIDLGEHRVHLVDRSQINIAKRFISVAYSAKTKGAEYAIQEKAKPVAVRGKGHQDLGNYSCIEN